MLLESGNNGVFMARNVANALVFAVSQTRKYNIGKLVNGENEIMSLSLFFSQG